MSRYIGHLKWDFSFAVASEAVTDTVALATVSDLVFLPEEEGFTRVRVPHVILISSKDRFYEDCYIHNQMLIDQLKVQK